ncbi:MAG: hypothetical protein DBX55_09400 [Verrucomicrobia bacterium]|nr:MAG: hypothetical protein DBX55_09400 [Verrucomicrobiota bacterium]
MSAFLGRRKKFFCRICRSVCGIRTAAPEILAPRIPFAEIPFAYISAPSKGKLKRTCKSSR